MYFSGAGRRTFPDGSCHSQNPALGIEVPVSKNDQVVVPRNVHKAAALSRLSLVSEGNQSLRASLLPGL